MSVSAEERLLCQAVTRISTAVQTAMRACGDPYMSSDDIKWTARRLLVDMHDVMPGLVELAKEPSEDG